LCLSMPGMSGQKATISSPTSSGGIAF
jgi:hypothetical protein